MTSPPPGSRSVAIVSKTTIWRDRVEKPAMSHIESAFRFLTPSAATHSSSPCSIVALDVQLAGGDLPCSPYSCWTCPVFTPYANGYNALAPARSSSARQVRILSVLAPLQKSGLSYAAPLVGAQIQPTASASDQRDTSLANAGSIPTETLPPVNGRVAVLWRSPIRTSVSAWP